MAQIICKNLLKAAQSTVMTMKRPEIPAIFITASKSKMYSTSTATEESDSTITKSVFISQSSDIFTNLAFEDWLYRNFDFSKHHLLLLWRNSPCVVIGRNQNPWLEANLDVLGCQGMDVARRNSGGGTVYHDRGNLNLTFFTPRSQYNRRNNLEIISRALFREWGIQTTISPREDLVVRGNYKQVSGTAAKLGQPNAYHHCTLLIDVNKVNLRQSLLKQEQGITTRATPSIPSPIMNLCEINRQVKVDKLMAAVGWEYLRTCPVSTEDGGAEQIAKQRGFQKVNPTESWFPGIDKLKKEFADWEWRYGKTPDFEVTRSCKVGQQSAEGSSSYTSDQELKITLAVSKGIINDVTLTVPPGLKSANGFHGEARVVTTLRGQRFSDEAVFTLENSLTAMANQEHEHEKGLLHAVAVAKARGQSM